MYRDEMRRSPARTTLLLLAACAGLLVPGGALEAATPVFATYGSTSRVLLEGPAKARKVDSLNLEFRVPNTTIDRILAGGAGVQLVCSLDAGRKGVKVTVNGTIVDALGRPNAVPVRKGRTKKDGVAVVTSTVPVTGTIGGPIEIRLTLNPAGGKKITGYAGSCGLVVQG